MPQHPYVLRRTCAKEGKTQAMAMGQNHNRAAFGAVTSGRQAKQEGASSQKGAGGSYSRKHPQQERHNSTQALKFHFPWGWPAMGGSGVSEKPEWPMPWRS